MGVPSFYRWLVSKYPKIRVPANEDKGEVVDTCSANPNGFEFDNLFLDMNGIIHPCFHPEDHVSPPTSYEDVFSSMYGYIDRLFSIVRPRKLLYMAIDGVAPRAKMNQQRSRRFRTARDNQIAEEEEKKLREQFEREGKPVLPKVESEVFDSNVITPGTKFMDQLSKKLKVYIKSRVLTDPGWKEIKVILSDANVPGEGEHKIMSFIRSQRSLPGYDPNTRHCLYGLDADLIMLALATHEVHFSILREDVLIKVEQTQCLSAIQTNLKMAGPHVQKSEGRVSKSEGANKLHSLIRKPYEFVHIWILREYLELEMKIFSASERFDLERQIDDFIFICFFAGNDFLPHIPSLEIHEGAIDLLMTVYKQQFEESGGYLVDMQKIGQNILECVKFKWVERFILEVGKYEEKIFNKRSQLLERKLRRLIQNEEAQNDEENESKDSQLGESDSSYDCLNEKSVASCSGRLEAAEENCSRDILMENTKELEEKLKEELKKKSDLFRNGDLRIDKVKFGVAGWKERYYSQKFSAHEAQQIEAIRKEIVQKYTEGLVWVLLYYYSEVPSWNWFYPYHYGPIASDLKGFGQVKIKFGKGVPFKPFDQLMAVLPPRSVHALPKPHAVLMTGINSTIIDYYPTEIEIDTDGKRFAWQGVCKLPFIVEEQLLALTVKLQKELSLDEQDRNTLKSDNLFLRTSSEFGFALVSNFPLLLQGHLAKMEDCSWGIGGCLRICCEDSKLESSTSSSEGLQKNTQEDDILCLLFEIPSSKPLIPRPLEGVNFPIQALTEADIEKTTLWHEYSGGKPCNNRISQGNSAGTNVYRCHRIQNFAPDQFREIQKGAGYGWVCGRGRASVVIGNRDSNNHGMLREQASVIRAVGSLRLSGHGNSFRPYGRGWSSPNVRFWRPRNESTEGFNYPPSGNDDRSSGRGHGNGHCPW